MSTINHFPNGFVLFFQVRNKIFLAKSDIRNVTKGKIASQHDQQ